MPKDAYVHQLFGQIASRYDLMNRILSLGWDLAWRRRAAQLAVGSGSNVLDIGTGTGDLAIELAKRVGAGGRVTGLDFSVEMLHFAKLKVQALGDSLVERLQFVVGDALSLPFPDESFDAVTMGFVLRNLKDYTRALEEVHRVLRPGGKLVILDLGRPAFAPLRALYYLGFFGIVPLLGLINKGNISAYFYLPRSLLAYPPQRQLAALMRDVGFNEVGYTNLAGGISCVHTGVR